MLGVARDNAGIERAAQLIARADALLITAGAGMGVDSGLPDFRGNEGMWRVYPALGKAQIRFEEIANPAAFVRDPPLAWGFYGHRLHLYRQAQPHAGFAILQRIAAALHHGAFVYTSNVDGQFQKAGFSEERICEVHGSIHHLQCCEPCSRSIWSAAGVIPEIDAAACKLVSAMPHCPRCGGLARPNILMFDDMRWIHDRSAQQQDRFDAWLRQTAAPVVVEIGAGTAIPTIRMTGDRLALPLIRINPREPEVEHVPDVSIGCSALEALTAIAESLRKQGLSV